MNQVKPLRPRREKSVDERATEVKARLVHHLEAIAQLMNEATKDGIAVRFDVNKDAAGVFVPVVNVSRTINY